MQFEGRRGFGAKVPTNVFLFLFSLQSVGLIGIICCLNLIKEVGISFIMRMEQFPADKNHVHLINNTYRRVRAIITMLLSSTNS